jgi:hypothetical protein
MSGDAVQQLAALVRSRAPLVVIETRDEDRARDLVRTVASAAGPLPVFEWRITEGLRRVDVDLGGAQRFNADPTQALESIRLGIPGLYVLVDFHPYLADPVHVRLLKDIAQDHDANARTIVLLSLTVELPAELDSYATRLPVALPTREERRAVVVEVARAWAAGQGRTVVADDASVDRLVESLAGLSLADTRRLARAAVFDDGAITPTDATAAVRAKYAMLGATGVLSLEEASASLADVAGMGRLKTWLARRRPAFDGRAAHLDPPRGVLLLGVQGCGKSLAAKAAAGAFGVPLLRLDLAGIHDKYVGESERRLRESLAAAEAMAPCVVWVDEIEKGLATSDGDAGAARRVLGTFLTWLAEKRGTVFVVATANDIAALPPELIRKGRFDEVFFVDLPTAAARAEVLAIHAGARGIPLDAAALASLAAASDGYSGAELEQAVASAEYAALAEGQPVGPAHILGELRATRPLSVVMAEQVTTLRRWAATRTVPAD